MDVPFDLFIVTDKEECQRTMMSWVFIGYGEKKLKHLRGLHSIFKAVQTRLKLKA